MMCYKSGGNLFNFDAICFDAFHIGDIRNNAGEKHVLDVNQGQMKSKFE